MTKVRDTGSNPVHKYFALVFQLVEKSGLSPVQSEFESQGGYMSRSRKKNPGFCDRNPYCKRQANKRVRRTEGVYNGCLYKKLYNSWNIHDYKYLMWNKTDLEDGWFKPHQAYMK